MTPSASGTSPRDAVAALCGAALLTVLLYLARAPFIDDSYITFRYAQRLAELGQLSWNDVGTPVVGTTTVLWTMFLSGLHVLGLPLEGGALAATVVIVFLLLYSLIDCARALLAPHHVQRPLLVHVQRPLLVAMAITAVAVLNTPVRVSLFTGMETALYCLLVLRAFMALNHNALLAGTYAGLATLTRPDGLILFVVGLLLVHAHRLRFVATFLVVTLPWFAYSFITFGELLPGSVEAKQLIYPSSALTNFLIIFEAHSQTPLQAVLLCVAGAGLVAAVKLRALWPLLLWLPAYGAGITLSGVKPIFFWYFTPTWLLCVWGGCVAGIAWLTRERGLKARALLWSLPAIVTVVAFDSLRQEIAHEGPFVREHVYRDIVRRFQKEITPDDTILVGETGILGFGFSRNTVIDSAGLTSREVLTILRAIRADASAEHRLREIALLPGWSKRLIEHFHPTWIIAARGRFDLVALENDPWFSARYKREILYLPEHLHGIGVYRLHTVP